MEDTLRGFDNIDANWLIMGLNPCSNGRYSQSSNSLPVYKKSES